jgi:uncharacterized membrane-anchored protein YhcB (DUF1043 family)
MNEQDNLKKLQENLAKDLEKNKSVIENQLDEIVDTYEKAYEILRTMKSL